MTEDRYQVLLSEANNRFADFTDLTTQPGVAISVWFFEEGTLEYRTDRGSTQKISQVFFHRNSDPDVCWRDYVARRK